MQECPRCASPDVRLILNWPSGQTRCTNCSLMPDEDIRRPAPEGAEPPKGNPLCECGQPRCAHYWREEYCTPDAFPPSAGRYRFSGNYEVIVLSELDTLRAALATLRDAVRTLLDNADHFDEAIGYTVRAVDLRALRSLSGPDTPGGA
jgi:hypothetical protein